MASSRSSRSKRFPVRRQPVVVVDMGCSCRRPRISLPSLSLSSIFSSFRSTSRKPNTTPTTFSPSTATSTTSLWDTSAAGAATTTTDGTPSPDYVRRRRRRRRKAAAAEAVEKDSSEPYLDFKESMLQMIVENEMYGWDDLNDLLHHLLSLNSPENHPLILRAFADIWKGILAPGGN